MHNRRNFDHFEIEQHHLHDHVGIRVFIIKMIILGVVQHRLAAESLQSCRRIRNPSSRRDVQHAPEQVKCQLFCKAYRKLCTSIHKTGTQNDIRCSSVLIFFFQSFINLSNIAYIMLAIRIHLDHVLVPTANGIFIAKLQSASITKIKNMRYYRITALF